MSKLVSKIILTYLIVLVLGNNSIQAQNGNWNFQGSFPDTSFYKGFSDVHGLAVDASGKVYIQPYYPTYFMDVTLKDISGADSVVSKAAGAIYVFNADGTPNDTIAYAPSLGDTVGGAMNAAGNWQYNSGRGMRYNKVNGFLYAAYFNILYKINTATHEVVAKTIPSDGNSTGAPAFDGEGNVYIGPVVGANAPIRKFDADLNYIEDVGSPGGSFSRSFEVAEDGTVYWAGWTNGFVLKYTKPDVFSPYGETPDTVLRGMKPESFTFHPTTGYLWLSAGSPNDLPGESPTGYAYNYNTWYAFDTNTLGTANEIPLDSLSWTVVQGDIDVDGRARAMAWTANGQKVYISQFSQSIPAVQVLTGNVSQPPVTDSKSELQVILPSESFSNQEITIPILLNLASEDSVKSVEFTIPFNANDIEVLEVSVRDSFFPENWMLANSLTNNTIKLAAAGYNKVAKSDTLLLVRARIKKLSGVVQIGVQNGILNEDKLLTSQLAKTTIIQVRPGDVSKNGQVRAYDATLILMHLVGLVDLDEVQLLNAEVTNDNSISTLDASMILNYVVGNVQSLPVSGMSKGKVKDTYLGLANTIANEEMYSVPIILENGIELRGFEYTIRFDHSQFSVDSFEWNSELESLQKEINVKDGVIKLVCANTEMFDFDGEILKVNFKTIRDLPQTGSEIQLSKVRWDESDPIFDSQSIIVTPVQTSFTEEINPQYEFNLKQNYPNPFNPTTSIEFTLAESSNVRLTVYNMLGQQVYKVLDSNLNAGNHKVQFNASSLSTGVYIYKIEAKNYTATRNMILIK